MANVIKREGIKEILSHLYFSSNTEALPRDKPRYGRAFKMRELKNHLNDCLSKCMELEKYQSVDEHMIKYEGKNIKWLHLKSDRLIKWGFKIWYRYALKRSYSFSSLKS